MPFIFLSYSHTGQPTGYGFRLPSEAEWEKAARGVDGRLYPWGDQAPTAELCNYDQKIDDTTPVDRYPKGASPYGALDMAGNVFEWTGSLYKPYPYRPSEGREGQTGREHRVTRSGAFYFGEDVVRSAARGWFYSDYTSIGFSFRVCLPTA